MKFAACVGVAGLATMVSAKAAFTNTVFSLALNQGFNLTWIDSDGTGPFTLYLKAGPASNLQTVETIASGITDFSYVFTPSADASLSSEMDYAFEIVDSTNVPNYSQQFTIQGLSGSSSSITGSSSSMASSTGTSSTSSSSASLAKISTTSKSSSSSSTSSASASASTTGSTSTTLSTLTSTTASATTSQTATQSITNTSDGQRFSSPIALLFVTAAALFFFN